MISPYSIGLNCPFVYLSLLGVLYMVFIIIVLFNWIYVLMFLNLFFFFFKKNVLGLEIGGDMNLAAGIQVAQLALKHRQNKKQHQRIIVFVGRYLILDHVSSFRLFISHTYRFVVSHFGFLVQLNMIRSCWR